MILKSKRFYGYIAFLFLFFVFLFTIKAVTIESEYWIDTWFSDKFFTYNFSVVYLLACSACDNYFDVPFAIRLESRKQVLCEHILLCLFLSLSVVFVLFIVSFGGLLICLSSISKNDLLRLIDVYIRFFIGLNMSGLLSLSLRYSNIRYVKEAPQLVVFLIILLELMVLPETGSSGVPIMFSWIFYENSALAYIPLLLWCGVLLTVLHFSIKKKDLSI